MDLRVEVMKIATLFSGIGAPEQAIKRVYDEFKIVFACELDKFARQSYEANYDIDPKHFHSDVNNLDATKYKGKVDILIGGSPCQTFSIAGLRRGTEDEKGKLIYQYIRVVNECRPDIIVYENVKGILSIDNGNTIKDFVQALRDIGYCCHYEVINTRDYGVPQNRERLYLVGFLNWDCYIRFRFADAVNLETRLKDMLDDEVDKKYYISKDAMNNLKANYRMCSARYDVVNPVAVALGNVNPSGNGMGGLVFDENYISPTLTTNKGEGIKIACHLDIDGTNLEPKIVVHSRIRKLTPRECFRLQDFPDDFRFVVSNSQLYKQIGNSMSVNVLEMIFNQIEKAKAGEVHNDRLF